MEAGISMPFSLMTLFEIPSLGQCGECWGDGSIFHSTRMCRSILPRHATSWTSARWWWNISIVRSADTVRNSLLPETRAATSCTGNYSTHRFYWGSGRGSCSPWSHDEKKRESVMVETLYPYGTASVAYVWVLVPHCVHHSVVVRRTWDDPMERLLDFSDGIQVVYCTVCYLSYVACSSY